MTTFKEIDIKVLHEYIDKASENIDKIYNNLNEIIGKEGISQDIRALLNIEANKLSEENRILRLSKEWNIAYETDLERTVVENNNIKRNFDRAVSLVKKGYKDIKVLTERVEELSNENGKFEVIVETAGSELKSLFEQRDELNEELRVLREREEEFNSKINNLEIVNNELRTDIEDLERNINQAFINEEELNRIITEKDNEIEELKRIISSREENEETELVIEIRNMLGLIEKNATLIASSDGNRRKQKTAVGEKSNRFIQEIDTEELVRLYKESGYKLTNEIKEHYRLKTGITYNGLRARLINAGVWKGKR